MNPNLHSKVAHCCLPRFNATFYIQFWTTSEKTPKTVTFIPNWWIHPCILALCISHQVMKSQQITCQEKGACTPNTVTVCCRNNFQGLGASLRASAPLPSQSQLKLLQQPLHLSSYTQVSPSKPKFAAKSEACSSLIGSWWILLINVNGANLIHGSWLDSHLEYARSLTHRDVSPQTWYHQQVK